MIGLYLWAPWRNLWKMVPRIKYLFQNHMTPLLISRLYAMTLTTCGSVLLVRNWFSRSATRKKRLLRASHFNSFIIIPTTISFSSPCDPTLANIKKGKLWFSNMGVDIAVCLSVCALHNGIHGYTWLAWALCLKRTILWYQWCLIFSVIDNKKRLLLMSQWIL